MTTRRSFIGRLSALPAIVALPIIGVGAPDVLHGQSSEVILGETLTAEFYRPFGRLTGDSVHAPHVRAITLDGESIPTMHVIEADDAAGWVLCVERTPSGHGTTRRLTGDVRFVWSEEALY